MFGETPWCHVPDHDTIVFVVFVFLVLSLFFVFLCNDKFSQSITQMGTSELPCEAMVNTKIFGGTYFTIHTTSYAWEATVHPGGLDTSWLWILQ